MDTESLPPSYEILPFPLYFLTGGTIRQNWLFLGLAYTLAPPFGHFYADQCPLPPLFTTSFWGFPLRADEAFWSHSPFFRVLV